MAGLDPAIHALPACNRGRDARHKAGHDEQRRRDDAMAITTAIDQVVDTRAQAERAGAAVRQQDVPDCRLPDPGDRPADGVPVLSAGARHLAGVHRHDDRPARPVRRPRELPVSAHRSDVVERGVLQRAVHRRRHDRKVRARLLAGAAAEQAPAVQEPDPRHRAAAVDRADGAVGDRVLVDLRSAVLDHLAPAGGHAGLARDQHRLPRQSRGARASR